jgi:hypothetical protein
MYVKVAANNLLSSLDESQMSREERRAIEQTPVELQQRYDALRLMMSERRVQYIGFFYQCCGSGMGKKSRSGSGMNIPNHISKSLETICWGLKYLNCLTRIRDPESF